MLRIATTTRPLPPPPVATRRLPPPPPAARPARRGDRRRSEHGPPAALPAALLAPNVLADVADGLEEPVQALYLAFLLGFLVVGAYLVVRQVLIRRELEEAAKVLGERVRTGDASPADSFELGVILLRKKLYTSALKSLDRARATWDGADADLAQVLNAIGYANFQLNKLDAAVAAYKEAVALQPGYVIAWNNLGDAHEKRGDWGDALDAYTATLALDPGNAVAKARAEACRARAATSSSVK